MTITERWVPITERYNRIVAIFDNDEVSSEKLNKYRAELFGTSMEMISPDTYNMITLGHELLGSYPLFKEMLNDPTKIRDVAKMIAQIRLDNEVELVKRHDRLQEDKRKKLEQKVKAKGKRK